MGWFSSACSFVGGCISAAVSIVSSAASALGPLASVALNVLKVASPYISALITVVDIVSKVLGVLNQNESAEEIGSKSLVADKTPTDFDTTNEYIEYLREEVDFDKEEFDKLSDEEKLARSVIGTAISMKAINETKGFEVTLDTWTSMAKLHDNKILGDSDIGGFIDEFKDNQTDLNGYVNKEIKGAKGVEVAGKMAEAYQKLEPELSTEAINDKVLNSKIGE